MADDRPNVPERQTAATVAKVLLIPSWIVGAATCLLSLALLFPIPNSPLDGLVGGTLLFGGFIAPFATTLSAVAAFWHTYQGSRRAGTPGETQRRETQRLWLLVF